MVRPATLLSVITANLAAAALSVYAQGGTPARAAPPRASVIEYFDKVQKDASLTGEQRRQAILDGIAAADRALAIVPNDIVALVYKNILTRMRASDASDEGERARLIAEADAIGEKVTALDKVHPERRTASMALSRDVSAHVPPTFKAAVDELHPRRVGHAEGPRRRRDRWCLRDYYPQIARAARVEGPVVVEVVVDDKGDVRAARPVRSLPLLDDAAVACVQEWKFEPPMFKGQRTAVLMPVMIVYVKQ